MLIGKKHKVTIRLASKSFLHAEILLPGEKIIHLITTHLQSTPPSSKDSSKYKKIRDSQCKAIREYIYEFIIKDPEIHHDPILLVGDLNIDGRASHDSEYKEIFQKYFSEFTDLLLKPCSREPLEAQLSNVKICDKMLQTPVHSTETKEDGSPGTHSHSVTYGDGPNTLYEHPYEQVLTDPSDVGSYQAIDHAFIRDTKNKLEIHSANINPLCVQKLERPISHISGKD